MTNFVHDENKCYVIAEIANAAQGVVEANFDLIDLAERAGADAVKFQFYRYDFLAAQSYSKYGIYKDTFYDEDVRLEFVNYAVTKGLDVWIDVFDRWGLGVVKKCLANVTALKIPPTIILDTELVNDIAALGKTVAIGVGGYDDEDIDFVLSQFQKNCNAFLMYGFQGFPSKEEDTVLSRIAYLKTKYGLQIGFADHVDANESLALLMPQFAFFAGAQVIEKHITLCRSDKGLDYYSSLEESEFKELVSSLRRCEVVNGEVSVSGGQKDYLIHATRAVVNDNVQAQQVVNASNIVFKRTDNAADFFPNDIANRLPFVAKKDISSDSGLNVSNVEDGSVVAVIIARMDSKRLPSKALVDLGGKSCIERCIDAVLSSKNIGNVIFATSDDSKDDELAEMVSSLDTVPVYRGHSNDPAKRMFEATKHLSPKNIIRVTGDTPLFLPDECDLLIEHHLLNDNDYSRFQNAPLGLTSEIFTTKSLELILENFGTDGISEYLTLYFKNNRNYFKVGEYRLDFGKDRFESLRFNLDYPEDLLVLKELFNLKKDKKSNFKKDELLEIVEKNLGIFDGNKNMEKRYQSGDLADKLKNLTTRKEPNV